MYTVYHNQEPDDVLGYNKIPYWLNVSLTLALHSEYFFSKETESDPENYITETISSSGLPPYWVFCGDRRQLTDIFIFSIFQLKV